MTGPRFVRLLGRVDQFVRLVWPLESALVDLSVAEIADIPAVTAPSRAPDDDSLPEEGR